MGVLGRHLPLVEQLKEADRQSLLGSGVPRRYAHGEAMMSEGDESSFVIAILTGWAMAVASTARGKQLILAIRGQGDLVGELAAIDERRRSTSVISIGQCRTVVIPGDTFRRFLKDHPQATLALLHSVAARLRDSDAERRALVSYTVIQRLARRLAELADGRGVAAVDGIEIDLRLPQQDLAASIGATREGAAKAMRVLRESGAVRTSQRRIVVARRDLLDLLGGIGDDVGTTE
jgi:CRP/FNR family transcriptional regulator, cyclic AMP receptor protein